MNVVEEVISDIAGLTAVVGAAYTSGGVIELHLDGRGTVTYDGRHDNLDVEFTGWHTHIDMKKVGGVRFTRQPQTYANHGTWSHSLALLDPDGRPFLHFYFPTADMPGNRYTPEEIASWDRLVARYDGRDGVEVVRKEVESRE